MLKDNNKSQFLTRFKKNKRGLVSFIVLCVLFTISLFAELIANDKPLIVSFDDSDVLILVKKWRVLSFISKL